MKKAWTDLKSFITVVVMILFAYVIVFNIPMSEEQKLITMTVVGFFMGSKIPKEKNESEVKDNGSIQS